LRTLNVNDREGYLGSRAAQQTGGILREAGDDVRACGQRVAEGELEGEGSKDARRCPGWREHAVRAHENRIRRARKEHAVAGVLDTGAVAGGETHFHRI